MKFILGILLVLAAAFLVLMVVFREKMRKKMVSINKPLFILGILLALTGAFLMWNGHILGENTTGIATVIGIIGIGLIATSGATSGKPKQTPNQ